MGRRPALTVAPIEEDPEPVIINQVFEKIEKDEAFPSNKKRGHVLLNIQIWGDDDSMACSYKWGETTYRRDGVSIGRDYLRHEGKTLVTEHRGRLKPEHLEPCGISLGRGAFSTVQLALWTIPTLQSQSQPQTQSQYVAVKQCSLLETGKEQRDMLLQELKTLCLVDNPALVKLHGAFLKTDTVTTVLEYMDAGSLDDLFQKQEQTAKNNGCLEEAISASIFFQALEGLSYLHNDRILHRDIKPANLLLDSKTGAVKLCDFGMAVLDDASFHKTAVGTTVYMAPERLRGKPYSRPSDIWSLGLVLWQCVTGQPPSWSRMRSMVDLLVTVEESDLLQDYLDHPSSKTTSLHLPELLAGCLQQNPAKRIPAALLKCSPWFQAHIINSIEDAQQIMRAYLASSAPLPKKFNLKY